MTTYAEVQGTTLIKYPYTFDDLQRENPYTNYGSDTDVVSIFPGTDTAIHGGYTLVEVVTGAQPTFDPATQACDLNSTPTLVNGVWMRDWIVRDLTDAEKLSRIPEVTDLQFRLALNQLGLRAAADTYINGASQDVKDWWDRALRFQFNNPMLQAAMAALGKTQADLEQLFKLANTL